MKINHLDAAVLLWNSLKASQDKDLGWQDVERTLRTWKYTLLGEFPAPDKLVESGIWAVRMMAEKGTFEHPEGITAAEFIKRLTPPGYQFNEIYGEFERIE